MTQILKKVTPFVWTEKQLAFDTLKQKLCEDPLLHRPDFSKPFILSTDASGFAMGGILSQGKIEQDKPIAYTSRKLSKSEKNLTLMKKRH